MDKPYIFYKLKTIKDFNIDINNGKISSRIRMHLYVHLILRRKGNILNS